MVVICSKTTVPDTVKQPGLCYFVQYHLNRLTTDTQFPHTFGKTCLNLMTISIILYFVCHFHV